MKSQHFIFGLLVAILFVGFSAFDNPFSKKNKPPKKIVPPGTVEIIDGLYCDKTEISNLSYREFLFWTQKIYGKRSHRLRSMLPDTTVWDKEAFCLNHYKNLYFRHPAFDHYPVVGISQDQARSYSKWRSDRVMEFWLVKNKKIPYRSLEQTAQEPFTIEAYFNNRLSWAPRLPEVTQYPEYRLPNNDERATLLAIADSLLLSKPLKKKHIEAKIDKVICGVQVCVKDSVVSVPMIGCNTHIDKKLAPCAHLRGNVAEWGYNGKIIYGGSWKYTAAEVEEFEISKSRFPAADIGFRNICVWKKWKDPEKKDKKDKTESQN